MNSTRIKNPYFDDFVFYNNPRKASAQQKQKKNGRWTKEEHTKFIEGLKLYGKNWKKIEELIETRNGAQIRSHAQKYFLRLEKFLGSSNKLNLENLQCFEDDFLNSTTHKDSECFENYEHNIKTDNADIVVDEEEFLSFLNTITETLRITQIEKRKLQSNQIQSKIVCYPPEIGFDNLHKQIKTIDYLDLLRLHIKRYETILETLENVEKLKTDENTNAKLKLKSMIGMLTPLSDYLQSHEESAEKKDLLTVRSHSSSLSLEKEENFHVPENKKIQENLPRPRAGSFQFYDSHGVPPSEAKLKKYRKLSECNKNPVSFQDNPGSNIPAETMEKKINLTENNSNMESKNKKIEIIFHQENQ